MRAALKTLGVSLAFFVGILAVTGGLSAFSPQYAVIFSLSSLGVSFLCLCKPIRFLGIGHRGTAASALFSAVFAAGMAYSFLHKETDQRLAMLAEQDPVQYLVELKDHDQDRWLEELQRLDPERHSAEVKRLKIEEAARTEKERKEKVARLAKDIEERCKSDQAKIHAYVMAQDPVKQRLKSPSTADFPYINKVKVLTSGECSFEIVGYVDAQNGFGAMIRSNYVAKITRDKHDDNGWRLDLVKFL
jgi:hypothetical protein